MDLLIEALFLAGTSVSVESITASPNEDSEFLDFNGPQGLDQPFPVGSGENLSTTYGFQSAELYPAISLNWRDDLYQIL